MSASPQSRGSGVDLPTLAITAAASAAAAYVCSQIWAPGTLGAAATMPVLVALLKEAFWKPAEVVTRAVPVRGVVRSARRDEDPSQPAQAVLPESERVPQAGEIPGASRSYRAPSWRAAVVTGLLGFVIAAVIITVPEFVAGSAADGDRGTTLFGGDERSSDDDDEETTETTAPTETQGVPPASTVTVPAVETTTVPAQTTTVPPAETTPAPPPQQPPVTTPQPPAP